MKVSDYNEIIKIQKELFDNELDRSLQMLSIFFDTDIEEIELLPIREVNTMIFDMNTWLSKSFIQIEKAMPNESVTLGNFIDLEMYLHSDFNKALSILFRGSKLNEWGHTIYEPIEFDLKVRADSFNDKEVGNYLHDVNRYVKFREMIIDSYKSIFGLDEPEEIETEGLTPSEIKEIEEQEEKDKQKSQYGWENFAYWLAGENVINIESVLNFPVLYALNMASMKKLYES